MWRINVDAENSQTVVVSEQNPANTGRSPSEVTNWLRNEVGIPPRFIHKSVDGLRGDNVAIFKTLQDVLLRDKSLLISSPCGRGKTHLAVVLLKRWLKDILKSIPPPDMHSPGIFVQSSQFWMDLKRSYNGNGSQSESEVVRRPCHTQLLVFDDLGSEKVSPWSRQMFYYVIDQRYSHMLPTVITTNLTPELLSEQMDDRIVSRMAEDGLIVELAGPDYRLTTEVK